ncbi:permease [Romboutsia lituseburensis]|uniref:Predicted permease n=1 Tax=Romboutsia lituseburensis DSM 797 TaxID=1121325 RepID=A0A1G9MV13_9FIRM|nr:permease [Romboutsia lituseburensis]CEH34308.1 Predicted permease [Romboutsia lituseburensis]SDL77964.1 Predicted permease [Romboutsia lituseburensis DSM 797]
MFSNLMYVLAVALLVVSASKDKNKTKMALKKAWKSFENMLPQFLTIIILIGIILAVVDNQVISNLIGEDSGTIGIVIASAIGSITLIPSFVAFPLAKVLLENGAGISQLAAFISTLMMVGIVTIPLEMKYWGKKATILRNLLAFGFSIVVAIIMGVIL